MICERNISSNWNPKWNPREPSQTPFSFSSPLIPISITPSGLDSEYITVFLGSGEAVSEAAVLSSTRTVPSARGEIPIPKSDVEPQRGIPSARYPVQNRDKCRG